MKRGNQLRSVIAIWLAALLVVSFPVSAFAQGIVEAQLQGQAAGRQHPTYAWAWSFGWGFFAGLFGWLGSVAYYATRSPQPDTLTLLQLQDKSPEYRLAYLEAYRSAARSKMLTQSVIGGGLGWGTWLLVYSAASRQAAHDSAPTSVYLPLLSTSW